MKGKLVFMERILVISGKFVKTNLVTCSINGRETINAAVLR